MKEGGCSFIQLVSLHQMSQCDIQEYSSAVAVKTLNLIKHGCAPVLFIVMAQDGYYNFSTFEFCGTSFVLVIRIHPSLFSVSVVRVVNKM
jgi:hypothetical protein